MQTSTTVLLLLATCVFFAHAKMIPNMPYLRQINDYTCGPACMSMIFSYFGDAVDQRALVDVMRTSNETGTLSFDLIRGAQFSKLSNTPTQYYVQFPEQAPKNGYNITRKLGYAALGFRDGETCWIDALKLHVDKNIPVIVLQRYDENDTIGHYRVVVGYDDKLIYTHDPWDRDGAARLQGFSFDTFCMLWNYTERDEFDANFGMVMYPLGLDLTYQLDVQQKQAPEYVAIQIVANISFPCYAPFCQGDDAEMLRASLAKAELTLPDLAVLSPGEVPVKDLNPFPPGSSQTVAWNVQVYTSKFVDGTRLPFSVTAYTQIHGHMPRAFYDRAETKSSPSYEYVDQIGAQQTIYY